MAQIIKDTDKSTTELLAEIGVRHEPAPGSPGYRRLYSGTVEIGVMHVMQANAFIVRAHCAA
jgi:hypothetical protein